MTYNKVSKMIEDSNTGTLAIFQKPPAGTPVILNKRELSRVVDAPIAHI